MSADKFNLVKNQFKELPNNIEAEQAVIGSILVSNDIFDDVGIIIDNKKFYDPVHQKIFAANSDILKNPDLIHPNQELIIPNL